MDLILYPQQLLVKIIGNVYNEREVQFIFLFAKMIPFKIQD